MVDFAHGFDLSVPYVAYVRVLHPGGWVLLLLLSWTPSHLHLDDQMLELQRGQTAYSPQFRRGT